MALRVTEGRVAEFDAREHVTLLDEPIIAEFIFLDRSLKQALCLTPIIAEVLDQ